MARAFEARDARLCVISSGIRAEEKSLLQAAEARGVDAVHVHVDAVAAGGTASGLSGGAHILIRTASYFQACHVAAWCEHMGFRVTNSHAALARFGMKSRTDYWMRERGLPAIPSRLYLGATALADVEEQLGFPVVAKPDIGGFGRRVHLLRDMRELQQLAETVFALAAAHHQQIYVQRYIQVRRDVRVLVVFGQIAAAMERINDGHLSKNVAQGAIAKSIALSGGLEAGMRRLLPAIGDGIYGVDLLEDCNGEVHVCEVNAVCRFAALASVSELDVADLIIGALIHRSAPNEHFTPNNQVAR